MTEIKIKDKQKYLLENYPFEHPPKLTDYRCCMLCDRTFAVEEFKVFKNSTGEETICCPNAPDCFGTVIDWLEIE
ncbi:MAG: hypothetical protein U0W24_14710 [Bacteroidales bacterium]